jgi:transcriptional regulator with XRE-family HTH domain
MKAKRVKVPTLLKQRKFVGANLREMRVKSNLTQTALAQMCDIDRKTINRIENGHFSPSVDTLVRIAKACATTPATVLKGIDQL